MNHSIAGPISRWRETLRHGKNMPEVEPIRVLVVDDHPLMRSGIQGEVDSQADMRVVAEGIRRRRGNSPIQDPPS